MTSVKSSFLSELLSEWRLLPASRKWLYILYTILLIDLILPYFRAAEGIMGLDVIQPVSNAIIIAIAVAGCFPVLRKSIKAKDIMLLLGIIVFHHISAVIHVGTAYYAGENASRLIWSCLPLFLVGLTVDTKTSPKLFVGMSYLALACQIPYLIVFGIKINRVGETEGMSMAYNLLPFVCFLVWNAIQRKKIFHIVSAMAAVFLLASLGARGPLICLVFFVAAYLVLFKKFKHGVFSRILIGIVALLIYVFSFEIAFVAGSLSYQLGLSERVYTSILEGQMADFENSNGRDIIFKDVLAKLRDNSIYLDANLYSDRLYTGYDRYYDVDRLRSREELDLLDFNVYNQENVNIIDKSNGVVGGREGRYAHNFELELLCDFGLLGGLVVILLLFMFILKAFRLSWNTDATIILLIFFIASIMQLQFSNSYLNEPVFWFFMGMCVSLIREAKLKAEEDDEGLSFNIR